MFYRHRGKKKKKKRTKSAYIKILLRALPARRKRTASTESVRLSRRPGRVGDQCGVLLYYDDVQGVPKTLLVIYLTVNNFNNYRPFSLFTVNHCLFFDDRVSGFWRPERLTTGKRASRDLRFGSKGLATFRRMFRRPHVIRRRSQYNIYLLFSLTCFELLRIRKAEDWKTSEEIRSIWVKMTGVS